MDERIQKIKSFLNKMNEKFPILKFKCGYAFSNHHTYIVEVEPLSEFRDNEEYAYHELVFCKEFECLHNDYDIIFVSDDGLCKVDQILLEVGYDNPVRYETNNEEVFYIRLDCWLQGENYALAA